MGHLLARPASIGIGAVPAVLVSPEQVRRQMSSTGVPGPTHMIIIAGHLLLPPEHRDHFVSALQDLVVRARAADGCLELAITADPVEPGRVQNLEVWRDADALARWRARADAPELDAPVLEDHVVRYDATDGGPVFP